MRRVYKNSLYVFSGYSGRMVLNDFYRFQLQPIGIPAPGLSYDLATLVNDASTADVQFVCGSSAKIVYAHSTILVARSEFFRALLTGNLRESSSAEPIPLPHVETPIFLKCMEYIYTDSIDTTKVPTSTDETSLSQGQPSPLSIPVALLVASEHFLLHRLKAIAEDWIMSEISEDTVVPVLLAAHQHNAASLKEVCLDFVQDNLNECGRALDELKSEPDLLIELLRRQPRQISLPIPQHPQQHQPR